MKKQQRDGPCPGLNLGWGEAGWGVGCHYARLLLDASPRHVVLPLPTGKAHHRAAVWMIEMYFGEKQNNNRTDTVPCRSDILKQGITEGSFLGGYLAYPKHQR